jgi:hypothetical protein
MECIDNYNYLKKISNTYKKKLICIVSFICLISLISCPAVEISKTQNNRNLQYSIGSIYYELIFPINNLTGTGDRLKDVPYIVKCKIKKCESGCCIGEINNMICGTANECLIYLDESKKPNLISAIIIPIGLLIIFIILSITFFKVYKISIGHSICYSFACLTIILIPCIAYCVYQECKHKNKKEKIVEG